MIFKKGSKGFDVSEFQNVTEAEMRQAKANGYDFVIIRASHGTQSRDTKFEQHFAAAKAAGLMVGVYAYYYYADAEKSNLETENLIKTITGKDIDFPVFVDFENRGEYVNGQHLGMLSADDITVRAIAAIDKIRAAGYTPGIYCDADWAKNEMQMERIPTDCVIWVADWAGALDYIGRCEIRQTSSKGTIDGIGVESVDLDEILTDIQIGKDDPSFASRVAYQVSADLPTGIWRRHTPEQLGNENIIDRLALGQSFWAIGITSDGWLMIESGGWIEEQYCMPISDGTLPIVERPVPYKAVVAPAAEITAGGKYTVNGVGHASSDGTGATVRISNKTGRVIRICTGTKYPYAINYTNAERGTWVDAWFDRISLQ